MRKMTFSLLMVALVALPIVAQDQTGTLLGRVTTQEGIAIAGANVTLSGSGLIRPLDTKTNNRGVFRFPVVAIGRCDIKIEAEQYNSFEQLDFAVNIGTTVTLNATLQPRDFEEMVTITGQAPLVDITSTDVGEVLTSDILQKLPIPRFSVDVLAMTPGNIGGDTVTLGGGSLGNTYKLDGVDVSDPETSSVWVFVNPESIEEIEVLPIAGTTADVGGFTGAALNMVTKSGGNEFSGGATFLYMGEGFTGSNTDDEELWEDSLREVGNKEATLFVGGPVIGDRAWFFANYGDRTQEKWWGDDDEFPVTRTYKNSIVKISAVPTDSINFGATWHYDNYLRDRRGSGVGVAPEATVNQEGPNNSFAANLVWVINDNNLLEVKAHGYDGYFALTNNGDEYSQVDYFLGEISGGSGYNSRFDRQRWQMNSTLISYLDNSFGAHEFKLGAELARGGSGQTRDYHSIASWNGTPLSKVFYEDFYSETVSFVKTVYALDSWDLNDRLHINAGVRYENQKSISPDFVTPSGESVAGAGDIHTFNNLAPRLGFTYKLDEAGKMLLRGSAGRYYEAISTTLLRAFVPNAAVISSYYWDGDWQLNYSRPLYSPTTYGLDSEMGQAYTNAITLGVEYETHGIAFGIDYMYRQNKNFVLEKESGYTWTPYTATGLGGTVLDIYKPTGDPYYTVTNGDDELYADYQALIFRITKQYSDNWQLQSSLTISRLEGTASSLTGGTSGQTLGGLDYYRSPNNRINRDGLLGGDRGIILKVNGTYTFPYEISVSLIADYTSERSWAPYDLFSVPQYGSAYILTEPRGSDRTHPSVLKIDARLDKTFEIASLNVSIFADVYNLLNSDTELSFYESIYSENFEESYRIMEARRFQVGTRISF
jgi:hypothetical protein